MNMRQITLTALLHHGIITRSGDTYTATTDANARYRAVLEVATKAGIGMNRARSEIYRCIERINNGFDPLKDNRGGSGRGQGRKPIG